MIKTIIFLIHYPLRSRDYERLGIDILHLNGFDVEIWDLTSLVMPSVSQEHAPSDIISYNGLTVFHDKLNVYKRLASLSDESFVICKMHYSYNRLWLYRALSKSGVNYAVENINLVPSKSKSSILENMKRIPQILNFYGPSEFLKILFAKLYQKIDSFRRSSLRPASLILCGGEKSLLTGYPVDKSTEVLRIHATDYDLYLNEVNIPCKERPVALFLDQFFPLHPHHRLAQMMEPIDVNEYYSFVNNFFSIVEKETGLEVVIASHPRSYYEALPDYFDGRRCIKGKTIKLIRECRFVMAHHSTALNFANLFLKPVLFLTYSYIDKSYSGGPAIREYAKWFGKRPIPIDSEANIDWSNELEIDIAQYDQYRKAYIKTEDSEDSPFWQIVANRLKEWQPV